MDNVNRAIYGYIMKDTYASQTERYAPRKHFVSELW